MIALALLLATVTGNPPPAVYSCTGAVSVFTIPFPYLSASQVIATQTTAAGVTSTVTGTVKPSAAPTLGTLTLGTACPSGSTLTISRSVPLTQPQPFRTGSYSGAIHEQTFDRLEMQIQQLNAKEVADLGVVNNTIAAFNSSGAAIGSITSVLATGATTPRTLAARFADTLTVKDFGAKCDGVTDDTVALQAALTAAVNGKRLFSPAGTCIYSSMLLLRNGKTVEIIGDGNRASIWRWNGAAGGTAFRLLNSYRTVLHGLRFDRGANDPAIMVEIQEDSSLGDYDVSAPSQLNRIEECTVKNGGIGVAVDLGVSSADVMNDTHIFDHNIMDGQTVANVQMIGANALRVGFRQNYFTGAPSAVQVLNSPGGGAPGFYWHGGYVASSTVNFDLQSTSGEGYEFRDVRSESSPRFLKVGPGGGVVSSTITIDGIFYSSAALHADGFAILSTAGGPYTIRGSSFFGTAQAKFSFALGNPADVIVEGNAFETANSVAATLVTGTNIRTHLIGNRYMNAAGTARVTKNDIRPPFGQTITTVSYVTGSGTSLGAVDLSTATTFSVVATSALAFGFDNPINGTSGQIFRLQIKNASGGALNAASPFGGGSFRSAAYTPPANGKNRTWTFLVDGTTFYQVTDAADVGN